MDEDDFNRRAGETLERIVTAIDDSGLDCDIELKDGGVIELEFENGTRMVINRHGAAREIWVAARSGGYHFRADGDRWVNTRDGSELFEALSRCVSEQSGSPVVLQ